MMLEFEPANEATNGLIAEPRLYEGGTVTLPVSEYNKLLRRADAAYNAVKLQRRDYYKDSRPIGIEIDKHWLYALAMEKLHALYSPSELESYNVLASADDLVLLDVTIAKLKDVLPDVKD